MNSEGDAGETLKRAAILRNARMAFITHGYAATKVEPIARLAGVSTATLYTLYAGKAELFDAVIEDAEVDFERQMRHVRVVQGDARTQLLYFARTYAGFMSDPLIRAVFRLVMAERPRFRDVALKFYDRGKQEFGGLLMVAIAKLAEAGELKVAKPSWAAGQLMGMIEHPLFFMPLVTGDELVARRTPEQVADDAVETFLARYGA